MIKNANNNQTFIIAHRGASAEAPENTISSFDRALKSGVDGIEFDIHLTKDEVPVVIHDSNLARFVGENINITDITLKETEKFDVGKWFNSAFAGEKIPTLYEVLERYKSKFIYFIELKSHNAFDLKVVTPVVRIINKFKYLFPNIIICSFNPLCLLKFKLMLPQIKIALIFHGWHKNPFLRYGRSASLISADIVTIHHQFVDPDVIKWWHKKGFKIGTWTVNEPERALFFINHNIDYLFTDNPSRIVEFLKSNTNKVKN